MRNVIVVLLLAVAAKLGINYWNYRLGMEEALIAAFSQRASEACRSDAKSRGFPPSLVLARPGEVRVVVGASDLDVWLWDVGNASWAKRYRTPHLLLALQSSDGNLQCSFDTLRSTAVVSR